MALALTLGHGVLTGIGKRPSAGARLPDRRLVAADVRIDPRRMAAYAEVCGYGGGGTGAGAVGSGTGAVGSGAGAVGSGPPDVPLTYPHILGFPLAARLMAARDFPLPLAGLIHTGIDIRASTSLSAADRPELAVHAEELRAHRRGTEVVVVTRARLDGEVVWTDRSTYLARHGANPAPGAPTRDARAGETQTGDARAGDARAGDAETGEPLPVVASWRLPGDLGRRHARVSGDYNPIHLYPLTARLFGYRRPIAHGMWLVARCAAEGGATRAISAEFRRPVRLPSHVSYASDGSTFELRSEQGAVHLHGTLT
ncbi:MaoC/PaaZ C-terminal domain-containing protein [Streptomyces sp. CA-111067]|uniref:MaoC/PaaZ C-terminal domain-containing protein n=1 Tax=Streptomyces sp. CA-111067 TaxID=3240046 RepID=UPI003D986DA0